MVAGGSGGAASPDDGDAGASRSDKSDGGVRRGSGGNAELHRPTPKQSYIKDGGGIDGVVVVGAGVARPPPHKRVSYTSTGTPQYQCHYCSYVSDS